MRPIDGPEAPVDGSRILGSHGSESSTVDPSGFDSWWGCNPNEPGGISDPARRNCSPPAALNEEGGDKRAQMPATPAWPPKSLPRLFVTAPLSEGVQVELDARQANYLGNVLRMNAGGGIVRLRWGKRANGSREIAEAGKKRMTLAVERKTARAGGDARPLARLRAGQAGADRLAGREGDRTRRRRA